MILILWVKFIICAGLIVIFGLKLSKLAQEIVKMGKLSEGLMGVLILAAITSFPEVWTSIASITKLNAPDLGIGDLIGSVIFNLIIIAALDFKQGRAPILSSIKRYHLTTCGFSLLLLGILIASLSLNIFTNIRIGFFNIGLECYLIFFIYIISLLYANKHANQEQESKNIESPQSPVKVYMLLTLYAAIIIGSGFWLASISKGIVDIKGWNEMYFGTILIAFTTSLPEIVVSISAVSIGSPDMAIANILGSNLFNMVIIPIADLLFRKGYILSHVSSFHTYSSLFAIIMTLIVFGSILYKPKRSFMRLGGGVILLILTFI